MHRRAIGFAAAVFGLALPAFAANAQTAASEWMQGNSSRIRLIVGKAEPGAPVVAGVQIELDEGWKTYWRNPGDAGGVPPELDWKASTNVAKTELKFPAPIRLKDANGENIGYKHGVILPAVIVPIDASKPMQLDLKILFGVCKNICIPEDRHLTVTFDPGASASPEIGDLLAQALRSVPADTAKNTKLPQVQSVKVEHAAILIDAQFPAGADGADLFAESPEGSYVPMAEKLADSSDGRVHFSIDLSKTDDFKAPSGKKLRLTLVSKAGASETVRALP